MDFQELLNIAAENNKRAQKEVSEGKRYTTKIPPPKKEKRIGVDQAAIRARLEKKHQDIKKKASEEEAKKIQLLKLRAESKKKVKKPAEKPKINGRTQNDSKKYEDGKHEMRHQTFIKKVQNVERTKKEEPRPVSKVEPDRSRKPKKPSAAQKGPMSYKQLLALAADQQKDDNQSESRSQTPKETRVGKPPTANRSEQKNPKLDNMSHKKAIAARKLGEARRHEFLEQRRAGDAETKSKARKSSGLSTNGIASQPHKTNGKVISKSAKQGIKSGANKPETLTSKPSTSTSKTKHSAATASRPQPKIADRRPNGIPNGDHLKHKKQELEGKRPGSLHQSRVEEYFDTKPSGSRPRPVPQRQAPPKHQSKLDKYYMYDRAPSSSRPRPGLERRAPSMDRPMKRPASACPPSFRAKCGRLLSEEDSDYEEDGFIDDTPLEKEEGADVSSYIKEIFGYDKSKYGYESDYSLRNMDASYREVQQEEARTARLGMKEDLEDIRREREENKRMKAKAVAKKNRR